LNIDVKVLRILKWYVDGSQYMHWDHKRHAGAIFTLGEGVVSSHSRKVKLNTQSSTKTELVVADMYMPKMPWSLYFMQSQGYNIEIIELCQDNKSTQLLKNNGCFLSEKRTKHIKVKFFFIKDRVDGGEMRIIHCLTEEMWADIMTKTLQLRAFRVMRAKLMNCDVDYDNGETPAQVIHKPRLVTGRMTKLGPTQTLQECVGGSQNDKGTRVTDRQTVGVARMQVKHGSPKTIG